VIKKTFTIIILAPKDLENLAYEGEITVKLKDNNELITLSVSKVKPLFRVR